MELWDLFDENRRFLYKQHNRQEPLAPGHYHVVVVVCVVNSKEEILVTLRHPAKETYANCWENTGGSVLAGETSRQGAVRELKEETGIGVSDEELMLLGSVRGISAFYDFYVVRKDVELSDIVLQENETADARWVTLEKFIQMGEDGTLAEPVYRRFRQFEEAFWKLIKNEGEEKKHENL